MHYPAKTTPLRNKRCNKKQAEKKACYAHGSSPIADTIRIRFEKKPYQYLYKDEKIAYFMNNDNYEQIEVPIAILGDDVNYIKEGGDCDILFCGDRAMSVDLPPKINLKVVDCDPGVKGNTASNYLKSATMEKGLKVKGPLFIKIGEKIRVDTRSGEYVERAKE